MIVHTVKLASMNKIKSLFKRDYEGTRRVYNEVVEGSEWVINGEGIATRKWDGTSCAIIGGKLYKRYDRKINKKTGQYKGVPAGAIPCEDSPNEHTGHWPHWVPCLRINPEDRYHWEAFDSESTLEEGTYELVGPRINGNPDKFESHVLVKHGEELVWNCPRDFEGIKEYLRDRDIEGVVWHHPDGRMVKIKRKDFNYE